MITVENKSNQILIFGRDGETSYVEEVNNFKPYFYYEDDKGKHISIDGKKLKKVVCKTPRDIPAVRERYGYEQGKTYEADVVYTNRFIIDRIDEIPKQKIRVCFLDIEIARTKNGYESPEVANNPILSISCYDNFNGRYTTIHDTDEKELLKRFVAYIKNTDPDILVAWNGDAFDFPFLINRINKIGLNSDRLARKGGKSTTRKTRFRTHSHIFGRVLFDLMWAYQKHFSENSKESWSLDYISKVVLGEEEGGKEEYRGELDDLYKEDLNTFLKYNRRDVELMVLIDKKLDIINFFDEVRRIAHCKFEDVFMNSKTADCMCLRYAKENDIVLPSTKKNNPRGKYEGGYVKDAEPKLYHNIAVLDMKSLYPSIMIGFNTSYETLSPDGEIVLSDDYKFKKEPGIIPSIVKPLLDQRDVYKKKMKKAKGTEDYGALWMTQYALKVIANSFYGVLGFRFFRLYKKEVAASITFAARTIIKEVAKWFEDKGYEVVYGDTDSVFISMNDDSVEDINDKIDSVNEYFMEYFKQFSIPKEKNIFKLEFEKIYKTVFFKRKASGKAAKKRYAGRKIWEDGEKVDSLDIKGFESRRSDSPKLGRDFLRDVLRMIVYNKDKNEIDEYVKTFKNDIKEGKYSAEELALPIGLSKDPDKYGNQIHAKASRLANKKHNANIKGGDKIKYIYVKNEEYKAIAFKGYMWEGYEIDYDNMIRRIVDLKIGPIYESLGWEYEYISFRRKKKSKNELKERTKQIELW